MNWLLFSFMLEIGSIPMSQFAIYDITSSPYPYDIVNKSYSVYVDFETEITFYDLVFIGGNIKTYIWKSNRRYTFWPHTANYTFKAGIRWNFLELGWRHFCMHPILPYMTTYDIDLNAEGAYDEIYLQLKGSIGGKK